MTSCRHSLRSDRLQPRGSGCRSLNFFHTNGRDLLQISNRFGDGSSYPAFTS